MSVEQKLRMKELMWIAKEGDYMSNAEFEELAMLIKLNGYKQSGYPGGSTLTYPQSYPQARINL